MTMGDIGKRRDVESGGIGGGVNRARDLNKSGAAAGVPTAVMNANRSRDMN